MRRKLIVAFFILFSFMSLYAQDSEELTTITITNARQTSYKKAEDTGNDVIVLEGSVELDVQKGSTTSTIKADKITYDRKTEMLYAEGNVEIETKGSSSGGEKTKATSLLLNSSTLEGIFDGGKVVQTQTDALNLPSGSTLIVFSDLFGKGSENTIAFKNSSLTFCDEDDPHWHIDATRTWLLPGGEFAFLNALLYVGVVPVLYLPAFYYPKDELVFNPVFGYTKREGYSVQTTTYVYGRKPLDNSSSKSTETDTASAATDALKGLYNFIKPNTLKKQKLEGLVLHNLDEDYTGDTSQYIKVMADWYSNLGYMVGIDSNFQPSNKYISKIALGLDIGISNTIFKQDSNYYPFSENGVTYKDESTFLGITMPFRYSGNFEFVLAKPFRVSLSLPIYSDPFYAYDYKTNRRETMDWISYLLENINVSDSKTEPTITEVSSFTWQLTTSASPRIPDLFRPYISSMSISTNSSVNISSMSADVKEMTYKGETDFDQQWTEYTPSRRFYYPSLVTPISSNISLSGTLFSWPMERKVSSKKKNYNYPITITKPDELKSESQLKEEAEKAAEEERQKKMKEEGIKEEKKEEEKEPEEELFEFSLPELTYSPASSVISEGLTYKLGYSVNANILTQMAYSSANLKKSEDFDWNKVRSTMYTVKVPVSLTSTLNYGGDFLSVVNGISYSPVYQKHPYISDDEEIGYTPSAANTLILSDYNAESRDVSNNNTITIKPFTYLDVIGDTSISWNSNIKVYRRKFIGDIENPEWDHFSVDWDDDDCITVNNFTEVLSAKEYNNKFGQSITFTEVLPPLLKQYTATLNLTFPYVTATLSSGIQENDTSKEVTAPEEEVKEWIKNPLQQGLNITIPILDKNLSITESYNYNLEDEEHDSFRLSSSWNGLSLAYVMSNTYGYDFDNGWKVRDKKEFLPYSLTFSYATSSKTFYRWFNRISISPGLNTSIVADLIRPTNSYFLFSPSITFKLHEFLNLTFSSTSRNSVLYWYFHNEEDDLYSDWGGFPGNILKDLFDSYRFDNKSVREGSGFKLKSLNMTLSHELHDWKFNMTLKIEPRMIIENGKKMYDFNPYMTIGIVWNPMESMKTNIVDEYGAWRLE